jgi:hypothetical protein
LFQLRLGHDAVTFSAKYSPLAYSPHIIYRSIVYQKTY